MKRHLRFLTLIALIALYPFTIWMALLIFITKGPLPVSIWSVLVLSVVATIWLTLYFRKSKKNWIEEMNRKVSDYFSREDHKPDYIIMHRSGASCWAISREKDVIFIFSESNTNPDILSLNDVTEFSYSNKSDYLELITVRISNPVIAIPVSANKKRDYVAHLKAALA